MKIVFVRRCMPWLVITCFEIQQPYCALNDVKSPGIYPYHCDPHPWMTGMVTVLGRVANGTVQVFHPSQAQMLRAPSIVCIPQSKAAGSIETEGTIKLAISGR